MADDRSRDGEEEPLELGGPVELPPEPAGVAGEAEIAVALGDPATPAGGERRVVAARGMVVNSAFFVGLGTLQLLKAVIVAHYLTAAEFGVWAVLFLAFGLVFSLKNVAVGNKYVQQEEADQEDAFLKAFTLELASSLIALVLMLAIAPLLALVYGESDMLAPGLALALVLPGLALQAPVWVYYRRMAFLRQRLIAAVDPVVGFVLTIALAVAGLGYWSLVIGLIGGAWAGAAAALLASPYRLGLRFEHATLREYLSFSIPLMVAVVAGLAIAQFSVLFGDLAIGLGAAGAIGLAATFAAYADRIDSVITQTLYPAICRVRDRQELLLEVFWKSNRLALMWAVPLGIGLSLFSGDLIEFGIGEQWREAEVLLVTFGLTAAISHVGFNWVAFYRARGETWPEAFVTILVLAVFLLVTTPLLFAFGLDGFAAGTGAMAVAAVAGRWYYLKRLFPGLRMARYFLRAFAPTAAAAAVALGLRLAVDADRTLGLALAELALYLAVNIALTVVLERRLIAEAMSYLRAPRPRGRLARAAG